MTDDRCPRDRRRGAGERGRALLNAVLAADAVTGA
jgi:hypothetical protein